MPNRKPRVSIGFPIYNAERFLEEGLNSLLGQTFEDFELIISDNGSTDRTEEICRDYLAADRRIRFYRNPCNLGAGWNHNRVLELAEGEYFKWASYDDLLEPQFLERCIDVLDRDSSVVLAHSKTRILDTENNTLKDYWYSLRTDSPKAWVRFADLLLTNHHCYHIYGLIRAGVIKRNPLGNFVGGDAVLLARLALFGRFYDAPECLFISRKHPAQSSQTLPTRLKTRRWRLTNRCGSLPCAEWWDPACKRAIVFPEFRQLREYARCLEGVSLSPLDRLACSWVLARWVPLHARRMAKDVLVAADQVVDNLLAARVQVPQLEKSER
jgi:glycosyltransferase involved in cell wall biosynthesis